VPVVSLRFFEADRGYGPGMAAGYSRSGGHLKTRQLVQSAFFTVVIPLLDLTFLHNLPQFYVPSPPSASHSSSHLLIRIIRLVDMVRYDVAAP